MKSSISCIQPWGASPTLVGLLSVAVFSGSSVLAADLAVLSQGHADIGIAFEEGEWNLHIHDEVNDVEYEPSAAVFQVDPNAEAELPADPRFSFLGAAGSSVWVLPQVQDPALLFLGVGAEEIPDGVFAGKSLNVRVLSMDGPGDFFMYVAEGAAGDPRRVVEVRNGVVDLNLGHFSAVTGGHAHYNWVFTQPGTYTLGLEVSGTLEGSNETLYSPKAYYTFNVVPEPSTGVLFAAGLFGAGLWIRRWKS